MSIAESFDYRISPQDVGAFLKPLYPGLVWLDSASDAPGNARYSYVTANPALTLIAEPGSTNIRTGSGKQRREQNFQCDPLTVCEFLLAGAAEGTNGDFPSLPPFRGGLAGYCSYDFGAALHGVVPAEASVAAIPGLQFGWYDWVFAWDHAQREAWIIVRETTPSASDVIQFAANPVAHSAKLRRSPVRVEKTFGMLRSVLSQSARGFEFEEAPAAERAAFPLRSNFSRVAYMNAVSKVREFILDGDIFQANISQSFSSGFTGSSWQLYSDLRAENAAPFAAYIETDSAAVLSASPEMFLHLDSQKQVESRPIKGTRPRGNTAQDEEHFRRELLASEKDRAENLMIVDLLRNDISRVCVPGSVYVAALFEVERWATVQHLVSSVRGVLGAGESAVSLFRAAFPGGSITGAPKVRAMQIIAEIERKGRGVYCGSIGYFAADGEALFNIAIRTVTISQGVASFAGGGGIVLDSDPAAEYEETIVKVAGLKNTLNAARAAAIAGRE